MTASRLLTLLSLLQTRSEWSGSELAQRLEVSPRTIRYDIDKLRGLGYPIQATMGAIGGYRLGAGGALPPLLLDDEEAVAVAVGLRTAAGGAVTGIEETSVRALAKLEQVLPSRLSRRVNALHSHITPITAVSAPVEAETLTTISAACRDHHRLRFDYRTHTGGDQVRDTEPHQLVHMNRRWYLVAWDVHRQDWRTFRADRMTLRIPHGPRFTPRESPPPDLVPRGVDTALFRYRAQVTVHAPADSIKVPSAVQVDPVDNATCIVHAGADTPYQLALHILMLDADFTVDGPPELLEELRKISTRCAAADPTQPTP
ncbi:transcriptional regulator [Actinomadura sp. 7K507]|uniref:helix-turn-helix transcriptional regulator n=1 Tax=Actinomadura sp. 7K507 TaxID=2530365 RepID=UPI001049C294|nr:transcriptional regulator [Actinomadura sp. 7K507]TDC83037.1 transcriptional regulator [Actinomadura sp. 7K507]